MKKMTYFQRVLALLFCVTMIFGVLPISVFADDTSSDPGNIVSAVHVTGVVEPMPGAYPDYRYIKTNDNRVQISEIQWKTQAGREIGDTERFQYGETYLLSFYLNVWFTYEFAKDYNHIWATQDKPMPAVTVSVNGDADTTVLPDYNKNAHMAYIKVAMLYKCDTKSTVSQIRLNNIETPVAGKVPSYVCNLASDGIVRSGREDAYYKNGFCWSEEYSMYLFSDGSQTFLPEKAYQVDIRIIPAEGYEFATSANGSISLTATVNGKPASVSGNKDAVIVTYVFPKTGTLALSKVGVTDIDAPVTGASPDYVASYTNVNYGAANYNDRNTKNGISWYNETDKKIMSTTDKFEAGKSYTVGITIWTNDGYEFSYQSGAINVAGTVNGQSAKISSRSNVEVTLTYTFPQTVEAKHEHSPWKVEEIKATCQAAGRQTYYYCGECGKFFEDAKCTKEIANINAWGVIPQLAHSGGKATCDNRAICVSCGERYGELAPHSFGSAWDYTDETGHAHKCRECGMLDTVVPHSGGTAKCGEAAKCAACGYEYGQIKQHQWSAVWDYVSASGHAHNCTVAGCDAHDTVLGHTPGAEATENSAQLCTVCGYILEPAKQHIHKMIRMDKVETTCTTAGKKAYYYCAACSLISSDTKGEKEIKDPDSLIIPATGHEASAWKTDAENHWKECTAAGCGEIISDTKNSHDFGSDNKCDTCGYVREAVPDTTAVSTPADTTAPQPAETTAAKPDAEPSDSPSDNAMWTITIIAVSVAAAALIAVIVLAVVVLRRSKRA